MRFKILFRIIIERGESMDNGAINYDRFLKGDDDGFVEIVKEYKDGLILYLNSFVNNIYVAEDLTEDTFVKIGIKKPRYKQKASFKTWLYTIGRNVALDYLRKKTKCKEISIEYLGEISNDELSLEKSYIKEEQKILLHKAMHKLKPEYRQVLWLVYFEEFSTKDIAKIMKKSVHNIETLTYRAKRSLKTILEKEEYIFENL